MLAVLCGGDCFLMPQLSQLSLARGWVVAGNHGRSDTAVLASAEGLRRCCWASFVLCKQGAFSVFHCFADEREQGL